MLPCSTSAPRIGFVPRSLQQVLLCPMHGIFQQPAKLLKFPARRRVAEETSAWLGRLDRGLQPDERAELEAWLAADPVHGQTLLRMAALWDNLDVLGELSELIALPQSRERAAGW